MPLILMCGFPKSGKTTFASLLKSRLEEHIKLEQQNGHTTVLVPNKVVLISDRLDDEINPSLLTSTTSISTSQEVKRNIRHEIYMDSNASRMEKRARAILKADMSRNLSKDTIVIVDAMNYIKGYRYELFCECKANQTQYCVVQTLVTSDEAIRRNQAEDVPEWEKYELESLKGLIQRFEKPIGTNRWDSPLFLIDTMTDHADLEACTDNDMHETNHKALSKFEEYNHHEYHQHDQLQHGVLADTETQINNIIQAILSPSKSLKSNMATTKPLVPAANTLSSLDTATRQVENAIIEKLAYATVGERIQVPLTSNVVHLTREIRPAELRKIRKAYLASARLLPPDPSGEFSVEKAVDMYVAHLNQILGTN